MMKGYCKFHNQMTNGTIPPRFFYVNDIWNAGMKYINIIFLFFYCFLILSNIYNNIIFLFFYIISIIYFLK